MPRGEHRNTGFNVGWPVLGIKSLSRITGRILIKRKRNNYSTRTNVNPCTGQPGTKPDSWPNQSRVILANRYWRYFGLLNIENPAHRPLKRKEAAPNGLENLEGASLRAVQLSPYVSNETRSIRLRCVDAYANRRPFLNQDVERYVHPSGDTVLAAMSRLELPISE